MSAMTELSAWQLRRAAEIKERIQSLEGELNRLQDSRETMGIQVVPKRRGRLRSAIKAGAYAGMRSAQRVKRQLSGVARAKLAAAARSRLERARNIEIT